MEDILGIAIIIFMIIAVVDIIKGSLSTGQKIGWTLFVLLIPVLGMFLYYAVRKAKMHKQRLVVCITGLIAAIAVFLPWGPSHLPSVNGLHEAWGGLGIGIVVMGLAISILSFLGDRETGLLGKNFIAVIVLDVLIVLDVFLMISRTDSGGAFTRNASIWFWMIPVMAVLGIIFGIVLKDKTSQSA